MTTKIIERDGKKFLAIEIEMAETPQPSGSGKTMLVASTHGPATTNEKYNGANIAINLNAYYKPRR